MHKRRISMTITEGAFRTLSDMSNYSEYLTRLVDHHDQQWRPALWTIRGRGFKDADLLVLIDKMHGYHPPGLPATMLVRNVIRGACGPLPGPEERWTPWLNALVNGEDGPEMARMICIIAAECWLDNTIIRKELGLA